MCLVELDEWARVSAQVATAPTVAAGARILCRALALTLGRPIALLSRDAEGWHFEAEGFPDGHVRTDVDAPIAPRAPRRSRRHPGFDRPGVDRRGRR